MEDQNNEDKITQKIFNVNLEGKILHVKVGDPSWSESYVKSEVSRIENFLYDLFIDKFNINCYILVTHYAVDISVLESCREVVDLGLGDKEVCDNEGVDDP